MKIDAHQIADRVVVFLAIQPADRRPGPDRAGRRNRLASPASIQAADLLALGGGRLGLVLGRHFAGVQLFSDLFPGLRSSTSGARSDKPSSSSRPWARRRCGILAVFDQQRLDLLAKHGVRLGCLLGVVVRRGGAIGQPGQSAAREWRDNRCITRALGWDESQQAGGHAGQHSIISRRPDATKLVRHYRPIRAAGPAPALNTRTGSRSIAISRAARVGWSAKVRRPSGQTPAARQMPASETRSAVRARAPGFWYRPDWSPPRAAHDVHGAVQ